jgi:hypothetical protein
VFPELDYKSIYHTKRLAQISSKMDEEPHSSSIGMWQEHWSSQKALLEIESGHDVFLKAVLYSSSFFIIT